MYALHHLIREVNLYNSTNKRAAFIQMINSFKGLNGSTKIDVNQVSQQLLDPNVEKEIIDLEKELDYFK